MKAEILPNMEKLVWDVAVDGVVVGYSKHSFDADYHLEILKFRDGVEVDHHPETRKAIMAQMEDIKAERKREQERIRKEEEEKKKQLKGSPFAERGRVGSNEPQ
jgi:hypothetical protein